MYSTHKFYCQHHNSEMVYNELITVGLKTKKKLVIKYKDITSTINQKTKMTLRKDEVETLISMIEDIMGDKEESVSRLTHNGLELCMFRDTCVDTKHYVIEFESEDRYDYVHLSHEDIELLYVVVSHIVGVMD